mgnify:CR=1 FL=1
MRVRGLKHYSMAYSILQVLVAPRAGAWVETTARLFASASSRSHPVRVRGLKLQHEFVRLAYQCRTPCGCVG